MCVQVLFVSGIPQSSETGANISTFCVLHMLLYQPIHVSFIDFFFFSLYFIKFMKQEQKLCLFFMQKRMTVEPENQEDAGKGW